ncbi:unnamed protein product [Caenorhabditis auriculariae]|uniref:Uncharacterized protein n=1 Tax=Caenorhabditis auriculariae TaxID=2777116 RepID=A0A8S1HJU3_9PELO|nr:unnamed protein product [Caenorhabditis auriculariae]
MKKRGIPTEAVKQNGEVNLLGLAINTVYNIETGLATPYTQAKSKISALLRRSDRIDVDDLTAQAALHHKSPKETHYLYLAGAAIMVHFN